MLYCLIKDIINYYININKLEICRNMCYAYTGKRKMRVRKMDKLNKGEIKVMVVDDMEDVCEFMRSHLRKKGCVVFTARSAEEALPIIREQAPDILILDVNLPKMSGIDLLKSVRPFNSTVKVFMATGSGMDFQDDAEFQKLNVLGVFAKPVNIAVLDRKIEESLLHQ